MDRLIVWAQGREWGLDAPNLDPDELIRGLQGQHVSHTEVRDWLNGYADWLPVMDGIGGKGRVRRDAIIGFWVKQS